MKLYISAASISEIREAQRIYAARIYEHAHITRR